MDTPVHHIFEYFILFKTCEKYAKKSTHTKNKKTQVCQDKKSSVCTEAWNWTFTLEIESKNSD